MRADRWRSSWSDPEHRNPDARHRFPGQQSESVRPSAVQAGVRTLAYARFLSALLLLAPVVAAAETVSVPLTLTYPVLRQLMISQLFSGPGNSAALTRDPSSCNRIILWNPQFGHQDHQLQIAGRISAKLGLSTPGGCTPLMQRSGQLEVLGRPVLDPSPAHLRCVWKSPTADCVATMGRP